MNILHSTAANIFASFDSEGKPMPSVEVVIIATEPKYTADETGRVVRQNAFCSFRFVASPEALRAMAKSLISFADDAEKLVVKDN